MAYNATFTANIRPLQDAIGSATPTLHTFEQSTKKVQDGLQRMVREFDGSKIIQQSTLMVGSIQKIGGATKLTEAEQRRVNSTLEEAIAKYRAIGQQAPKAMTDLYDATKKVGEATKDVESNSRGLSSVLTGAIAGGVAAVGTAALSAAGNLARMAVQGLGDLVKRGGEVAQIRTAFVSLAGGIGEADQIMGSVRKSTQGLVGDFSIMQASNRAMLLGVTKSSEEMGKLAATAATLGRAMGQDATKSLEDLITALGRSSPLILDNLGLTVSVGKANEEYAASVGKTAEQLTDAEKKQAFMTAALAAADVRVRELGGVSLTFADRLGQVGTQLGNVRDALAEAFSRSPALNAALTAIGDNLTRAFGDNKATLVDAMTNGVDQFAVKVVDAGLAMVTFGRAGTQAMGAIGAAVTASLANFATLTEVIAKLNAATLEATAAVPGLGRGYTDNARRAREFATFMDGFAGSLRTQTREYGQAALGAGQYVGSLDVLRKSLIDTRMRMVEASVAGAASTKTASAQAKAHDGVADALSRSSKESREAEQAAKRLQQATDAFLGRDIVAKANELVKIYQAVGRQLPPTAEGQKRVNQALAEALPLVGKASDDYLRLLIATSGAVEVFNVGMPDGLKKSQRAVEDFIKPLDLLIEGLGKLNRDTFSVPNLGQTVFDPFGEIPKTSADKVFGFFGETFASELSSAVIAATAGGGSVGDTVGAVIGQAVGRKIGQKIGEEFGKAAGEFVGPILGTLIGEIVGVGFEKLFKTEGKQVNDVRDQYVLAAGGIGELDKRAKEAGVTLRQFLAADSVKEYNAAIIQLELAFKKLEERIKTALSQLSQVGSQGQLLNDPTLLRTLLGSREREDVRSALAQFIEAQTQRTVGGLNTFLQNSQISGVGSGQAIEGSLLASFGALTQQGASPLEAINQLLPAIEAFGERTKTVVGFEASAAFTSLQNIVALVKDEIAGPVIQAVGGLGDVLVGLNNTGFLTQDIFTGLTWQIFDSFHQLELMGKGGVDAARAMQQPLQRTWELVQDFGFAVDDDTKKLLDFAESSGLIGDKFRPAADRMAAAIDTLVSKFDSLIKLLETNLVNTARNTAGEIERAFGGIRPGPIRIGVVVDGDIPGFEIPEFQGGSGGLRDFGPGTLAMLHGREAVMTEAQMKSWRPQMQPMAVNVYIGEEAVDGAFLRAGRSRIRLH